MGKLTHLDDKGQAHMVDVSAKAVTERIARAAATITMEPATDRKSTRLNSNHSQQSRMPSSA